MHDIDRAIEFVANCHRLLFIIMTNPTSLLVIGLFVVSSNHQYAHNSSPSLSGSIHIGQTVPSPFIACKKTPAKIVAYCDFTPNPSVQLKSKRISVHYFLVVAGCCRQQAPSSCRRASLSQFEKPKRERERDRKFNATIFCVPVCLMCWQL